jgi:hypothetical protein
VYIYIYITFYNLKQVNTDYVNTFRVRKCRIFKTEWQWRDAWDMAPGDGSMTPGNKEHRHQKQGAHDPGAGGTGPGSREHDPGAGGTGPGSREHRTREQGAQDPGAGGTGPGSRGHRTREQGALKRQRRWEHGAKRAGAGSTWGGSRVLDGWEPKQIPPLPLPSSNMLIAGTELWHLP